MEVPLISIILALGSFIVMVSMLIGAVSRLLRKTKGKFNALLFTVMFLVMFLVFFLSLILVPGFQRARVVGQLTACKSNTKNIGTALEIYAEDNNGLFPHSLSALTPEYLQQLPKCSSTDEEYGYTVSDDLKIYTVYCSGKNAHKKVHIKTGFPQYSSREGLTTE